MLLCRETFSVTCYCYIQEMDEGAGKGMVIAGTDKWNKTERWGNETEVRKSLHHKLRHLNYNLQYFTVVCFFINQIISKNSLTQIFN